MFSRKAKVEHTSAKSSVEAFIKESPSSVYTFDSERDAPVAELCRQAKDGQKCIQVEMASKQLFETMQNLGFFCALPIDPTRTYMECTPIPK